MNRRQFLRATGLTIGSAAFASIATRSPAYALNLNQSPGEFKFGLFAGSDAEQTKKNFEPFRVYLEKAIGVPVTVQTGTSYSAVIEAMRGKFVDGMEVGPFAHVLASSQMKVDALSVGIYPRVPAGGTAKYNAKESPFYYSVIVTRKGSGIKTLADLKGKKFAFVDPASTSGHLMPRTALLKGGLDVEKDLETIFAGSHPSVVVALTNGKVDAGATFEQNLIDMTNNGQADGCVFADGINRRRTQAEINLRYNACKDGQVAIIQYSDPIPNTPFGVRDELPPQFKEALKSATLKLREDAATVAGYKQWYVDPVTEFPTLKLKSVDSFFNGLRDAARLLKLDLSKLK